MNEDATIRDNSATSSLLEDIVEYMLMNGRNQELLNEMQRICSELLTVNPANSNLRLLQGVITFILEHGKA
jgi:hypothetical protein